MEACKHSSEFSRFFTAVLTKERPAGLPADVGGREARARRKDVLPSGTSASSELARFSGQTAWPVCTGCCDAFPMAATRGLECA